MLSSWSRGGEVRRKLASPLAVVRFVSAFHSPLENCLVGCSGGFQSRKTRPCLLSLSLIERNAVLGALFIPLPLFRFQRIKFAIYFRHLYPLSWSSYGIYVRAAEQSPYFYTGNNLL